MVEVEVCKRGVAGLASQILEERMRKPQVAEKMPKVTTVWPRAKAKARAR